MGRESQANENSTKELSGYQKKQMDNPPPKSRRCSARIPSAHASPAAGWPRVLSSSIGSLMSSPIVWNSELIDSVSHLVAAQVQEEGDPQSLGRKDHRT